MSKENHIQFQFCNFFLYSIRFSIITEALFAQYRNLSSQLYSFSMSLADPFANANLLHYLSFNSTRIASCAPAAKFFALSQAFYIDSTIHIALNDIHGRHPTEIL